MKLTKRQKRLAGYLVGALLAGSVGSFFYIGWAVKQSNVQRKQIPTSLTHAADSQSLPAMELKQVDSYSRTVVHTGTVQTRSHTMVAFQRGGMVTELLVDEGQQVSAVQTMAVLDSRQLVAKKDSLKAKLEQAQSVLAELRQGPREESIETARNVVADLEEQVKGQKLRLKRSDLLLKSNSIARQDYERELYATRGLEARLKAAQSQLAELLAGTRTEQIDAQESLIKSIQADLQIVQFDLDDCSLQAPFAGMVVSRYIDSGAVVSAGTPVYELIDNKNLEVHVGVPQAFASQLQAGATYVVVAGESRLNGTLRVVLPRIEASTRTCKAIFDVKSSTGTPTALFTGQLARVELNQEIEEAGFWIPRLALTADHSGLWSCYIVDGGFTTGVAVKQSVEILHQRDEWVFVRGTIRAGQLLISDGMHRVVPGQQITVQVSEPKTASIDLSALPESPEKQDAN